MKDLNHDGEAEMPGFSKEVNHEMLARAEEFVLDRQEKPVTHLEERVVARVLAIASERFEPRRILPTVPGYEPWQVEAMEEWRREDQLEERILRKVRKMIEEASGPSYS